MKPASPCICKAGHVAVSSEPRHARVGGAAGLALVGGLNVWEFEVEGHPLQVRVDGSLILNDGEMVLHAALAGLGIAMACEATVAKHITQGRLVRVLHTYCRSFPGCFLHHPSSRQTPPVLKALIDALQYKAVSR